MKKVNKVTHSLIIILVVILTSIFNRADTNSVNNSISNKKPIFRVNTEEKHIALTFDINWAEKEYLYDILEILNKYNVKATFFIMGGWVNYSPENKEKLINIMEGGHEIGNHSYIHPSFTKINKERIKEELKKTDDLVFNTVGVKPILFRFPSGDYNEKVLEIVTEMGYIPIQWDVDSVDWKQNGEEIEYERVMKKVRNGSILLFHNNAKYTPKNLDRIINKLLTDGYEFVKVGELIYENNYIIDENGEQQKNNY